MNRRNHSVTLLQATQEAPALAHLFQLTAESTARLQSIQPLLPPTLRTSVRAGPIDGANWCLLLDNGSVAAKIRQLLPALQAHLRSKGYDVNAIRLKIQTTR